MSLLLGWGAYARDKNTSARLCAKKAGGGGGGAYARGGVFAGHYGINNVHSIPAANAQSWLKITTVHISDSYFVGVGTRTGLQIKNIVMLEECYCAKQLQ